MPIFPLSRLILPKNFECEPPDSLWTSEKFPVYHKTDAIGGFYEKGIFCILCSDNGGNNVCRCGREV
jgi:hypothetical protein